MVSRFQTQKTTHLGPGEYLSQNLIPKFAVKLGRAGTQNFRGPERNDLNVSPDAASLPGPQQYAKDHSKSMVAVKKALGSGRPFGINTTRFRANDNGVPGAG